LEHYVKIARINGPARNLVVFYLREFIIFGLKQARACIFAGSFFVLLFLSNYIPLFGLARYDFLFIAAILIQIVLYVTKVETKDEVKTIILFHVLGLALELFKTSSLVGSWSYPEAGFFKIATVPLFSGFMYAAVGSYIAQSWKIMKLRMNNYKFYTPSIVLSVLIYINFFTDTFIYDFRWILIALVFILFYKTWVYFTVTKIERRMPMFVAFLLISFFIWVAENISTFYGAWKYPDQIHAWNVVSSAKISSWFLLVIISFILVADLKRYKSVRNRK
jgi:uncharacterized membrane protein YoaT (DUF817 family)